MAPYLAEEIRELDYKVTQEGHTGVEVKGSLRDCIYLNLYLRTAHKVLFLIKRFKAPGPKALYDALREISWGDYLKENGYFSIDNFVQNDNIKDTRFASLKVKDAIADHFQDKIGKRPDSGPNKDRAVLFLFWQEEKCAIFLDTSGEPLSKHGYRQRSGPAPLSEALAGAIIRATRWVATQPFINPMCGTGTLAIEAALWALNRPPGLLRNNFGFMHIKGYNSKLWNQIRENARKNSKQSIATEIIATDHDPKALKAAEANARKAGVLKFIQFKECQFQETPIPDGPGTIVMNPPYGERMEEEEDLADLYRSIGDFLKQEAREYQGFIFTGNLEMIKHIGLRTKNRIPFYNGKIDCRLLEYDLY